MGTRTTCNVKEDLSDVPRVCQSLEMIQPFLNHNPGSALLVLESSTGERGVFK